MNCHAKELTSDISVSIEVNLTRLACRRSSLRRAFFHYKKKSLEDRAHEKVRTLDLAPLSIAIYRHVVSNVLENTHTLPLDVGFASDV